ncbi:AAA family ATPase [Emticicia agri]|uniref:HD domain-containing protein n=1 Tax=Emticicia agri TaxID=2492393 RepID=A0A4Q5M1K7_9BACT|nr:AAA family ATPase [Emticicia agri]RYU95925.1 HD domain-containing protein [Emticicia agri]
MWQLSKNKTWEHLYETFLWVRDMRGVPQDARHHAERDVEIHTRMVVEEMGKLPEFQDLDAQAQEILWASALMHDIEKRSTTVLEQDGSITSKGHAKKGERTVRQILYREIPTPFGIRETIAKLVRYHGLPLWIFEKENPEKALYQASLAVNLQWLVLLAKADVLGRECADKADLLYRVELFKEFCIEKDCWGKPKAFPSNLARFEYFNKESRSADYEPYQNKDSFFEVIVLSALPGTGKDTYIQKQLGDIPVISLDNIRRELKISPTDKENNGRVIQLAKEQARVYLRRKQSFVWNATNITRQNRQQLIDLMVTYGATVKLIYLEVPYLQLLSQNRNREYVVPVNVLERMIEKLEIPQIDEAHEVIYEVAG